MNRISIASFSLVLTGALTWSTNAHAQSFSNGNSALPATYNSGGCVGFADLDGDGYDDLVILDQSRALHTLYQSPTGTFTDYSLGNVSGSSQWGMCVGDFLSLIHI